MKKKDCYDKAERSRFDFVELKKWLFTLNEGVIAFNEFCYEDHVF